jgi:uncharacterized protein (TIRG00374 family)
MTEKEATPQTNRSNWRRTLLGILVSVAALVLLLRYFDWREVADVMRDAEWVYLILMLPIYLGSYIFRAMAWRLLLMDSVPLRRVFLTMNVGYLLNNTLPLRLGELGRAYLLGRDGLGFWRVFSTIIIERAFDLIIAAGLLLGTLPFVWDASYSSQVAIMVLVFVFLGLLTLHLLARYRTWVLAQFDRLGARWPLIIKLGRERLEAFLDGLETLVSFGRFARVFAWMVINWFCFVIQQYLILRSFYPDAKFLHSTFTMGVSSLGAAVPSSPGYIGVYEAAVVGALALFDIPFATAFAHALTAHFIYIFVTGILGLYGLSVSSDSLGQIFRDVQGLRIRRNA